MKQSVIFPIIELLDGPYTNINYKTLCKISKEYSIRYMNEKEREALNLLKAAYKEISTYNENEINASVLFEYFENKLKEHNIEWRISPIYFNGELIDCEPPEGWFALPQDIENILKRYVLEIEEMECQIAIKKLYDTYCRQYFSKVDIPFFRDGSVKKIIQESKINRDWKNKFENMKKQKEAFLSLNVCRELRD